MHDLSESPTMAIEWFEDQLNGEVIEDLKALRRAIDALPNLIYQVFYQFILATGLRKSKTFAQGWTYFREDRINSPVTKNGLAFDLPILPRHLEILEPVRDLIKQWVFPSTKSEKGYIGRPVRLRWSPHAHGRTTATVEMEAGVLEEVIGRLVNHTPKSITGLRYANPSLDALGLAMQSVIDELVLRRALQLVALRGLRCA